MLDYFERLLTAQGLPPHGYCLLWDPVLVWTHVVSDVAIGLAYFSIPVALAVFVMRRRDVQFGWVVWMFAAFILACGATHFFSVLTLWQPAYGPEGLLKLFTAAVSVATAAALWPLLPRALAVPSPAQLQLANAQLSERVIERDQAFAALEREVAERSRVEEMLRQAQKMEAVGQLTGGIAHDFNNLLTVITANLERAQRMVEAEPRLARSLEQAMAGADRAAKLTHQLLAFSRRAPLKAERHQLNDLVAGMEDLLQRTLGSHIAVRLELADGDTGVLLDATQAENAVLNLAINARDAMPEGGELLLATRVEGDMVELAVEDTGEGMTPEVLAHAFEPFFTTKELGSGTGLGLSQVYGFAQQSGGDATIANVPGGGVRVVIKLPYSGAGNG